MHNSGSMNDFKRHLGQPKKPLGACLTSISEVWYPLESIVIRSKCEAGAFRLWAK